MLSVKNQKGFKPSMFDFIFDIIFILILPSINIVYSIYLIMYSFKPNIKYPSFFFDSGIVLLIATFGQHIEENVVFRKGFSIFGLAAIAYLLVRTFFKNDDYK